MDNDPSREQSAKKRYQSDLFILEADKVREERRREDFVEAVRRLKMTINRLEVEQQEKEAAIVVSDRKLADLKTEITTLKKKMNGF